MSNRYKGGVISATPPTTTGGEDGVASGAWTLEQQMQLQAAGLWPAQPTGPYIEQVFSTYLYTGTGSALTINNGINLSGKGGLVWIKNRTLAANHSLADTVRGYDKNLASNTTAAQITEARLSGFTSSGFSLTGGYSEVGGEYPYVSWTFRKQPKFFDIVTWTGDGTAGRTVAHNLGSVPGSIFVKCTSFAAGGGWPVYHRSLGNTQTAVLNTTDAAFTYGYWNNTTPTSTVFTLNGDSDVNGSGRTYVAYLFAHDAGGFGLTGSDNVISCGSFTTDGSGNATVNLGFEPQWIIAKEVTTAGYGWQITDNMRGLPVTPSQAPGLLANTSAAEVVNVLYDLVPTSTGFNCVAFSASKQVIYIAIRRGPMKVPTSGTSVFSPVAYSGTGATRTITAGFPVDLAIPKSRGATGNSAEWYTRLIGPGVALLSAYTFQELARPTELTSFASNTGVVLGTSSDSGGANASGSTYVDWNFQRAPSFFDEVVAKGNDADTSNWPHNLGVPPELIIRKSRTNAYSWSVWAGAITGTGAGRGILNSNAAWASGSNAFLYNGVSTNMTSLYFSTSGGADINSASDSFVTYLFATCAGVSKVGSYTGTGTTLQIDCGFTGGARFVLIKRTDSTGDWYVWDSARGIVAGNDPYLLLNSTAAEVTGTDYVDTYSAGFEISSTAPAAINANGGTFIFLAIA